MVNELLATKDLVYIFCSVTRLPSRIWIKNPQLGTTWARKARSLTPHGSKFDSKGSELGIIWLERLGAWLERLGAGDWHYKAWSLAGRLERLEAWLERLGAGAWHYKARG